MQHLHLYCGFLAQKTRNLTRTVPKKTEQRAGPSYSPLFCLASSSDKKTIAFNKNSQKVFDYDSEILVRTKMCDVAVAKSRLLLEKLKNIYNVVDYSKGDTLNILHGNYELSIIIGEKNLDKLLKFLRGQKILNIQKNLVSLAIKYDKGE